MLIVVVLPSVLHILNSQLVLVLHKFMYYFEHKFLDDVAQKICSSVGVSTVLCKTLLQSLHEQLSWNDAVVSVLGESKVIFSDHT